MIVDERVRDYLLTLEPDEDPFCGEIREDAQKRGIPIIKRETGALLAVLVSAVRPGAILEIGTAVGYSAIGMARAASGDCFVTTIEKDEEKAAEAQENVRLAGLGERIRVVCGNADEVLWTLPEASFGMVFMDAAKGQYGTWLPDVLRLLRPGGVLVADNVLQGGTIAQSRFAVERRDRTIHSRMREFLWKIKHCEGLEAAVLPVGDGVAVAVKR